MRSRATAYATFVLSMLAAPACEEVELPSHLDAGFEPVVRAAKSPPLLGGTLLVAHDGRFAVISDPPRDSIHIVDLELWEETATIELEDGALPFRATEDSDGLVHISLRGTGKVLTLDPETARISRTTSVCPNPRGVAFDEAQDAIHVACAGGLFVTVPRDGGSSTQRFVAPDLRDVFVIDGRVYTTRFRAAEIYEVLDDGTSTLTGSPISLVTGLASREPSTAWRTIPGRDGGWLMLHQQASTASVPPFEEPSEEDDPIVTTPTGYSGGDPCNGAVRPALSTTFDDDLVRSSDVFVGVSLAVDVALSPDGIRAVVAAPAQQSLPEESLRVSVFEVALSTFRPTAEVLCKHPEPYPIDDDVVAVAFQPNGAVLAQARDKPILYRVLPGLPVEQLQLTGDDATDTGFELFHNDAGQGIACASCHPEGGEDGRTWVFEDTGPRRTQPLNVGLEGTAPFHWKGDMEDIHMIARQVRQGAMGGIEQSIERQEALRDWMFALRPPNPLRPSTDSSAVEGQQLFESLGCTRCHAGPSFTSPVSADLGRGPLQTPALRGVAMRAPFMHDARSRTLEEAVADMVSTTTEREPLDDGEMQRVVAYLESL